MILSRGGMKAKKFIQQLTIRFINHLQCFQMKFFEKLLTFQMVRLVQLHTRRSIGGNIEGFSRRF